MNEGPAAVPVSTHDPAKGELRARVRQRRAARDAAARRDDDQRRTGRVINAISHRAGGRAMTVAASWSGVGEPDTSTVVQWLVGQGHRVLLPVLRRDRLAEPGPAWAWFTGVAGLQPGRFGFLEPAGEVLPATALVMADLVLCPGLAAGRDGTRLGTGGGWYDRALPHRRVGVATWVLVNTDEVFDTVPVDAHDVGMDAVVTPQEWLASEHG